MIGRRAAMKALASILAPSGGKRKQATAVSGGFNNPLVGGGGSLVYPSIHSPNFNIANPPASPAQSWAILKNGLAYLFGVTITGGTITGPDYIINSSGAFFYTGPPALGNLAASIVPGTASVSDPEGNTAKPGVTVYDTGGARTDYIQLLPGSTSHATVNIGTGDTAEATPGQIISGIAGTLGPRTLGAELVAPKVAGEAAGAIAAFLAQSPSVDLSTSPLQLNMTANDGAGNSSTQLIQPTQMTFQVAGVAAIMTLLATGITLGKPVTATAGSIATPTLITTDTWTNITPAVNWAAGARTPQARLYPDNTVRLRGQMKATAATLAGATMFTLAFTFAESAFFMTANSLSGWVAGGSTVAMNAGGTVTAQAAGSLNNTVNLDGCYASID